MIRTIKKVATIFLLIASLSVAAQESAMLQYNFKKGDQYVVELSMKQDMTPIMNMDINLNMVMKALGKEGNNLKTSYQIKRMKMLMGAQGQDIEFDSDAKDEDLSDEEKKSLEWEEGEERKSGWEEKETVEVELGEDGKGNFYLSLPQSQKLKTIPLCHSPICPMRGNNNNKNIVKE